MKNVLFNSIPKASLDALVRTATRDFAKIYENGVAKSVSGCAMDLAKVKQAISDNLGPAMAEPLLNIIKAAMPKGSSKVNSTDLAKQFLPFVPYACVVPLRNRNHHEYPIGEPTIMVVGTAGVAEGMHGIKMDGTIDDDLPRLRASLRPASVYEITKIVNALYA